MSKTQEERYRMGEKVDKFRTYLFQRTFDTTEYIVFKGDELPIEQEIAMAQKSMELMNGDFREDNIQVLADLLKEGETLYVTKKLDDPFYQGTLSSGNNDNFEEYTSGDFLVIPEETLFSIMRKNDIERTLDKQWTRIPESLWWDRFSVLPPMKHKTLGKNELFMISEAESGSMHGCYAQVDGKYYTAVKNKFDDYQGFIDEIREQTDSGTLKEGIFADKIKIAIDDGSKVYWSTESYIVEKTGEGYGDYDIVCAINQSRIGLTHRDEITLNGKDEDFIIVGDEDDLVMRVREKNARKKEANKGNDEKVSLKK